MRELRQRRNVVAKQPSAEADNDVTTPDDDVTKSRDSCLYVVQGIWTTLISRLYQPVDASSLAVFRTLFGKQPIVVTYLPTGLVVQLERSVHCVCLSTVSKLSKTSHL